MARKRQRTEDEEQQRQSRKDILLARKRRKQTRQIRIGVALVLGLLGVVAAVALVTELIIAPNQIVATVSGVDITLGEWQERVRLDRAQLIVSLETQLELVGGDVGVLYQFGAEQFIAQLTTPQGAAAIGQAALDSMVAEVIIEQAAAARGITVTEADIDAEIATSFNYFGGDSPTPFPTATATIMPTPSITPIPTAVITEVIPTDTPFPTPTIGPTFTPLPTATPLSESAFLEQYNEQLADFQAYGYGEDDFRRSIRMQLLRERLMEAIAEEQEISSEAEHASFFLLSFDTETEANEALALVAENGYLTTWNEIRSLPPDPESGATGNASETLWQTLDAITNRFTAELAEAVFSLPIGEPSDLILQELDEETTRYYIVQVTGREVRELSPGALLTLKQQALSAFIEAQLVGNLVQTNPDQGRVPTQPILDPIFTAPPTQAPGTGDDGFLPPGG